MSKFKVGDKVRRTGDNYHEVVTGKMYTVVTCTAGVGLILEGLEAYGYSDYNFELVE